MSESLDPTIVGHRYACFQTPVVKPFFASWPLGHDRLECRSSTATVGSSPHLPCNQRGFFSGSTGYGKGDEAPRCSPTTRRASSHFPAPMGRRGSRVFVWHMRPARQQTRLQSGSFKGSNPGFDPSQGEGQASGGCSSRRGVQPRHQSADFRLAVRSALLPLSPALPPAAGRSFFRRHLLPSLTAWGPLNSSWRASGWE